MATAPLAMAATNAKIATTAADPETIAVAVECKIIAEAAEIEMIAVAVVAVTASSSAEAADVATVNQAQAVAAVDHRWVIVDPVLMIHHQWKIRANTSHRFQMKN